MVDVYGDPQPRAVVLLHGAVVNRGMWATVGPEVAALCPALAFDLPGHGDLRSEAFRLESAVRRVAACLDEYGVREAVLVGESMGGYVALAAARRCGARLVGLVLSGCSLNPIGPVGWLFRACASVIGAATAGLSEERLETWTEAALRRSYSRAPHDAILAHGLSVHQRSESLRELAGRDFVAPLSGLDAPVLLVNGSRDLPNRAGERAFLRQLEEAESRLFRGVGHGVAMACPRRFSHEVALFLDRHEIHRAA